MGEIIIHGILFGAMIALMAVGFQLIFGILRVVNYAHGEFLMWGALIVYFLVAQANVPYFIALVISVVALGIVGFFTDKAIMRRFHGDLMGGAMVTLAMLLFLLNLGWFVLGPRAHGIPAAVTGKWEVFGTFITAEQLLGLGISISVLIGFVWFLKYTKLGKSMRAAQQDEEAALTVGINIKHVTAITFALADRVAQGAQQRSAKLLLVHVRLLGEARHDLGHIRLPAPEQGAEMIVREPAPLRVGIGGQGLQGLEVELRVPLGEHIQPNPAEAGGRMGSCLKVKHVGPLEEKLIDDRRSLDGGRVPQHSHRVIALGELLIGKRRRLAVGRELDCGLQRFQRLKPRAPRRPRRWPAQLEDVGLKLRHISDCLRRRRPAKQTHHHPHRLSAQDSARALTNDLDK